MKIFIIKSADNILHDNNDEYITLVTTDEEKAYSFLYEQISERNYLSIWENEKEVSEYYRDWLRFSANENKNVFSKWERNSGEINERLEKENGNYLPF